MLESRGKIGGIAGFLSTLFTSRPSHGESVALRYEVTASGNICSEPVWHELGSSDPRSALACQLPHGRGLANVKIRILGRLYASDDPPSLAFEFHAPEIFSASPGVIATAG